MPAHSPLMLNFQTNVLRILRDRKATISWLAAELVEARKAADREDCNVSRPFISNLLHGKHSCTIPFAEEIAAVLDVPLVELLQPPKKFRQPA